jgi:hypothetical protein
MPASRGTSTRAGGPEPRAGGGGATGTGQFKLQNPGPIFDIFSDIFC